MTSRLEPLVSRFAQCVFEPRRRSPLKKELPMIAIHNVFQLKFGKAREAVALRKESPAIQKRALAGADFSARVLTDVTGPFYTLVLELT